MQFLPFQITPQHNVFQILRVKAAELLNYWSISRFHAENLIMSRLVLKTIGLQPTNATFGHSMVRPNVPAYGTIYTEHASCWLAYLDDGVINGYGWLTFIGLYAYRVMAVSSVLISLVIHSATVTVVSSAKEVTFSPVSVCLLLCLLTGLFNKKANAWYLI